MKQLEKDNIFRKLQKRILLIVTLLLLFTVLIWGITFVFSPIYPTLLGLVILAYGFGLRHAVDADHIAAIDTVTRKLMHEGKRPLAVGFFFSLGHATVVILLCIIAAFSAEFVKNNLSSFSSAGGLIGASVSSIFLIIIGISNLIIFLHIFSLWRSVRKGEVTQTETYTAATLESHLAKRGILTRLLRPFLKTVQQSWHMYVVGFLFGLGFDTATEVGLITIAAITGTSGMPIAVVLLLPLAFTAGMVLIDTLDGIFMLGAYGWAYITPLRKLSYNLIITGASLILALTIGIFGVVELLSS